MAEKDLKTLYALRVEEAREAEIAKGIHESKLTEQRQRIGQAINATLATLIDMEQTSFVKEYKMKLEAIHSSMDKLDNITVVQAVIKDLSVVLETLDKMGRAMLDG